MSSLGVLKSLWHAWSIRSCILLSLVLQAFLLLVAPLRKRPLLKQRFKEPFFGLVWLAYIQREWFNIFVIGLMSWNNGDPSKPKDGNEDFMALWASFLLLQAGGPDAITSFAIEDNQLWLRHLLQLTLQVLLTANIFCLSFPQSKIWIPAAMMFLAGTISYAERVYALYLACLDRSGPSEPRKPYHGLDYEEALRLHCSVSAVDVAKRARGMPRAGEYAENSKNTSEDDKQELVIRSLTRASRFLDMLKGFIRGTIFSSIRIEESKEYFLDTKLDEASRVIEYELSFLYDLLHTKVVVFRNRQGYILRAFCFLLILAALIVFLFLEKQHKFPDKLDVNLSYALLWGTLVIELINALSLMFSDWTVIALKDSRRKFFPEFILERLLKRQRWSRSCFQYDMISYCLNGPPTWLSKWAAFMHLGKL